MQQFQLIRKEPKVEAVQWQGNYNSAMCVAAFMGEDWATKATLVDEHGKPNVRVNTVLGSLSFGEYDWLVRHTNGDYLILSLRTFTQTYEPAVE